MPLTMPTMAASTMMGGVYVLSRSAETLLIKLAMAQPQALFGSKTRVARRLDDGSVAHRVEAEWFIGSDEVFIYYSVIDYLGRWELHLTHTQEF